MNKSNNEIVISVEWGYEQRDCLLSNDEWDQVNKGIELTKKIPYVYEGEQFTAEWAFNYKEYGSLLVSYDDGGVGFDGALKDANITLGGIGFNWSK